MSQPHQPFAPSQAPAPATETHEFPIVPTPLWVTVIRGFQFFLAIIILGLSGYIIHYVYMDELGLSLTVSLFTWIITVYAVLTEKIPGANPAYNVFAVLALDAFMMIMWLATMGAVAAKRSTFIYSVRASCSTDGSLINSGSCTIYKRAIVMSYGALDMMSAIAGLSALQLILFIACFVYVLVTFLKLRKDSTPTGMVAGLPPSEEPKPMPVVATYAYPVAPQPQPQQQMMQPMQAVSPMMVSTSPSPNPYQQQAQFQQPQPVMYQNVAPIQPQVTGGPIYPPVQPQQQQQQQQQQQYYQQQQQQAQLYQQPQQVQQPAPQSHANAAEMSAYNQPPTTHEMPASYAPAAGTPSTSPAPQQQHPYQSPPAQ